MSKARGLADLGNVYSDGALSNRNMVINGAMQVAQRGTSFASGIYQYTLDRWSVGGGHTVSRYTDASGKKWLDATNSNATWFAASQKIENGDYLARNNSVTVSFDWEQVTATAVASVRLFNDIDIDEYINIPEPSVSGRKTITFTVGAISLGSGWLGVGVYNAYATAQSGRFRITNFQLEVGDTATPFEHRSYGQELALCQRYYQKDHIYAQGYQVAPTDLTVMYRHAVDMRASPTLAWLAVSIIQVNVNSGTLGAVPNGDGAKQTRIYLDPTATGSMEYNRAFSLDSEL